MKAVAALSTMLNANVIVHEDGTVTIDLLVTRSDLAEIIEELHTTRAAVAHPTLTVTVAR